MKKGDRVDVWDWILNDWCQNCGEVIHNDGHNVTVKLDCGLHIQEDENSVKKNYD